MTSICSLDVQANLENGLEEPKEDDWGSDPDDRQKRTVFVGNMPPRMNLTGLRGFLTEQFGKITFAKYIKDFVTKQPKGCAYVTFQKEVDARKALAAKHILLNYSGWCLIVDKPKQKRHKSETGQDGPDKNCTSPIGPINEDCLVHILMFLDPVTRIKVERVSKAWQRCSWRAFKLQRHLTIREKFKYFRVFTKTMLEKVLSRCGPKFVSLDLSFIASRCGNKALHVVGSCCPSLTHLDMSGMMADNRGIHLLTERCHYLKSLTIVRCCQVTQKGFGFLFRNCQEFESLDCSGNAKITGKCFKHATHYFKYLNAPNCNEMDTIPNLDVLDRASSTLIERSEGVLQLAEKCPNMEHLNLLNCVNVDRQAIETAIRGLPKLKVLNIGGLDFVSNYFEPHRHVIRQLASPATLTRLMIDNSGLSDDDVYFLCSTCPQLVELDISCNRLTDYAIEQLSFLDNLEVLHICHLFKITSISLLDVIARGKLKVLRAHGCKGLDNELFESLATDCPQLEELDIAGIPDLTDRTVTAFIAIMAISPHRSLVMYVFGNEFCESLPVSDSHSNLSIVCNYRHLYKSHQLWLFEADDHPHNIVLPPWEMDDVQDIPAELMHDEYDDYDEDDEEFYDEADLNDLLINDDPLGYEYYNMS